MAPRPPKEKVKGACGFCHQREQTPVSGVLYKTPDDEVAAHFNCMLFSPPLVSQCTPDFDSFGGFLLEDVKKEIKRGSRLRCNLCKQSGATVGCDVSSCKKSYHYLCALKCDASAIEDEKNGIYKIFCARHRPDRVSNADENADDSKGVLISTDEEISLDGADDDGTCDDDIESDTSFGHVESSNIKEVQSNLGEQPPAPSTQVLNTPKRNMLKRPKSSTPQEKETNGSCRPLDFSGNAAAAGLSSVQSNALKSEDPDRVLGIGHTPESKRADRLHHYSHLLLSRINTFKRKRIDYSDSSESSSSKFDIRPAQNNLGEYSAVPSTVKDSSPQWIKLLSQCYSQIKHPSDVDGQTNMIKGRDFWDLCKKENCMEALLKKMKESVESNVQNILHQTASDEDCEQAFHVLRATGCLQNIAREVKQEIKDKKEALEREKANLLQKEQMLDEILDILLLMWDSTIIS
ncbi:PHD finger protein 11 isoform X3 [Lissotriton helveticus]